ncbi:hypothetical protein B4923_05315 [Brenneria roseae subsp. americana]|uniref:Uncharacterized protein n=1 Tax=Brenneria roseae subsp. americana TaxID=1508507 RepID=A0A2U1TY32_9GAMM|nr:hypothetical protein [Brenneria roseae]PWC14327.1 hypothetical protein B4923_05315 [Brenneria roseae subsp. americana]
MTANEHSSVRGFSLATLLWGIASLGVSVFFVTHNNSAMVLGAGTGALILAGVIGTALGWLGALLGQVVRNFAHPDAVYTSGGIFNLIGIRLFWLCGPQLIGLVCGSALGISLILR